MGDGTDDEAEAFDCAAGFAGETENERLLDDGGEIAGENGVLGDLHRLDAHDFAEAGEFTNGDLADGFGGDVAEGDAGAAGAKDELGTLGDLFLDGALNFALFVRDEFYGNYFPTVPFGGFPERGSAEVVVKAFGGAVRDGDDAGLNLHATSCFWK